MTPVHYISSLYKRLPKCFTSGSFVIQDNDEKLYKLLKIDNKYHIIPWTSWTTHASFTKYNKTKPHVFNALSRAQYDRDIFTFDEQQNNTLIDRKNIEIKTPSTKFNLNKENNTLSIKIQCGNFPSRIIRNIKFYQFTINDKPTHKYVFLKLEQNRTWTIRHLVDYYKHLKATRKAKHAFFKKKSTKIKAGAFTACEDCHTLCNYKKQHKKQHSLISSKGDELWNMKYRTGDEIFVSQSVNNLILSQI